jgi:hypothetical protein
MNRMSPVERARFTATRSTPARRRASGSTDDNATALLAWKIECSIGSWMYGTTK